MTFFEHLEELRRRFIWIGGTVGFVFLFTFTFGFTLVDVYGVNLLVPYPTLENSVSVAVFNRIWIDLMPPDVVPYSTLAGGMVALIKVSLFLGVLFGMPMIVYHTVKFIAPGLYPNEKKMILKISFPAGGLFLLGCAFAYIVIIPFTIRFLLDVINAIGGNPLITVNDFISFILLFTIAFGVVFELPIIMLGLTYIGAVGSKFWRENWRYAFVAMVIFGGVITPDGSGITQLMVALPMLALYAVGYLCSAIIEKRRIAS